MSPAVPVPADLGQEPQVIDDGSAVTKAAKRPRAKQACRECNARRVRCNVTESHPCSNCQASGTECELFPSQRGRYPRKRKPKWARTKPASNAAGDMPSTSTPPASTNPIFDTDAEVQSGFEAVESRLSARSPSLSTGSADASGVLFFGESNLLTLVPGIRSTGEEPDVQDKEPDSSGHKARMLFCVTKPHLPAPDYTSSPVSAGTSRYLRDEGALTIPNLSDCIPALQAYFTWFHPCFPVVDREEFARNLSVSNVSYLLLQSMLFIAATYCDNQVIASMGFSSRTEAKSMFYTRARLLFHADWEKDQITLMQSLFLMSFWRGGPSDVRDVRYWLGVVIGVAESHGLHRSAGFTTRDPKTARLRRRIWWSIYVRERQAAASLGLPSRIRDDDCDVEPLRSSDLASNLDEAHLDSTFGSCTEEHITYAIKMVEIAKILGQVVDTHFAPGRQPSTPNQDREIDDALERWRLSLPRETTGSHTGDGGVSIWGHLLHLAYNHIRILIHRQSFLRPNSNGNGQVAVTAASCISRIAEDMLEQGVLRYGQMHLVTSLFSALCIHTINIKRGVEMPRRIAEHRAQMCLLGLQEIQKYWRINNNILDLFLKCLDVSVAGRLHGAGSEASSHPTSNPGPAPTFQNPQSNYSIPLQGESECPFEFRTPQTEPHLGVFEEDEFFNLVFGPWEGDALPENLDLHLQGTDLAQMEGLDLLGRSL